MNKEVLREKYKKLRKEVLDKKERDSLITRKVLLSEEYKKANTIAIYVSKEDEVDTKELIDSCLAAGKTVCVPITGPNQMLFSIIKSSSELTEEGIFKIGEPKLDVDRVVLKNEIDLFIVPVLAFDRNKNRIGYGKGYYDKYLKNERGYKIGIAYDIQMTSDIDTNENDICMDEIITERRLVK